MTAGKTLQKLLVLTGDHGLADPTKWDGGYTEDDLRLHGAMLDALCSLGRWDVSVCTEHATMLDRLRADPPELVVNFCDTGFGNEATRELHVPALLEVLGIPYTGSSPTAMVLSYDKPLVNLLARELGIPSPRECTAYPDTPLEALDVAYPAFVKPASGDGSVGINRDALVPDATALAKQLAWFREQLPGRAAVIQEYLPGAEYGLALLGNPGSLQHLPPLRVDFSALPAGLPPILAFESKTGPDTPYEQVRVEQADLDEATLAQMVTHASALFERLGCRDYARFDFRTAADGTVKLMEVNPNPAWSREAKLALMASFGDIEYPKLLERIVDTAWARCEADISLGIIRR